MVKKFRNGRHYYILCKLALSSLIFQITRTYDARESAVKKCILYTQEKVQTARSSGETSLLRPAQLSVSISIVIMLFIQIRCFYEKHLVGKSPFCTQFPSAHNVKIIFSYAYIKMNCPLRKLSEEELKVYFTRNAVTITALVLIHDKRPMSVSVI
jgi:hypothetical protein